MKNRPRKFKLSIRQLAKKTVDFIKAVSPILSIIALVISIRVFMLTQRPHIGIADAKVNLVGNPPNEIHWTFQVKNSGAIPGQLTLEENRSTVTTNGQITTIPSSSIEHPVSAMQVLVGQVAFLNGSFKDSYGIGTVADVLSGKTKLEVYINLSYKSEGILYPRYYHNKSKYHLVVNPLNFLAEEQQAN